MRTEDQKGNGRDSLALQACKNDEAELGLVLTMGHKPSGVPGRVRVSLHHIDGLVPEAADHLLRYMVEAFKKWPDLYKAEVDKAASEAPFQELVISYDIEQDNLFDVLNHKNEIPGLSHAWEEDGDVVLGVVDGWTEAAFEAVKKVCRSFGYHTVLVDK